MCPPAHKAITICLSDACTSYWRRTVFYGALPLRYRGYIPATRIDRVTYTGLHLHMGLTSLVLRRTASIRNLFIPSIFDLVISGLFELKIHTDRRRIRTVDYECCMIVRTADYHSAIRRFCNRCLK